jgi:hypothetical protein
MAIYVDSLVSLQCRVNEKPDIVNHPKKEGKQKHDQWDCQTGTITLCEWNWRFEEAKKILCSGLDSNRRTYYDDVIGGLWTCDGSVTVNEGKFNER